MPRFTIVLNTNSTSIVLNSYMRVGRSKITKFRMIPDNITSNVICVQIEQLNTNNIIGNGNVGYFFMLPFINNTSSPIYNNDLGESWDYTSSHDVILNKIALRITDERGNLITLNNSSIVLELLLE